MCKVIRTADGASMIVCGRVHQKSHRGPTCCRCREPVAFLCDGPIEPLLARPEWKDEEGLGRCSAPLCAAHAVKGAGGKHFCFHHRRLAVKA
jgi:hypothetical protein